MERKYKKIKIMKTTLQELKKTIQEMINHGGNEDLLSVIAYIENTFIEKEKQQIIKACEKFGNLNGVCIDDYEEYYNETYKPNKINL